MTNPSIRHPSSLRAASPRDLPDLPPVAPWLEPMEIGVPAVERAADRTPNADRNGKGGGRNKTPSEPTQPPSEPTQPPPSDPTQPPPSGPTQPPSSPTPPPSDPLPPPSEPLPPPPPASSLAPATLTRLIPTDPLFASQWHLRNSNGIDLNVTRAWVDWRGEGVRVAVSGQGGVEYTHPDLIRTYDTRIDRDWTQGDNDAFALPGERHETSVAGVIAAAMDGQGAVGVAPEATIAALQFALGDFTATAAAFREAAAAFDVITNSWGYPTAFTDDAASSIFRNVLDAMKFAADTGRGGLGTVSVWSGGNYRSSGDDVNAHNLKNSIHTMAVAAISGNGAVASFSSPGVALHVAAPGHAILTTDRTGTEGYASGDWATISGTSFAAPAVAGVVALMLDANPNLGWRDVQEILALSARQLQPASPTWVINKAELWNGGGLHHSRDFGFGLVDATAAVRLAETWTLSQTSANQLNVSAARSTAQAIPDGDLVGLTQTVSIGQAITVEHVSLRLDLIHTWRGQLTVSLISPQGTESVLLDRIGATGPGPGSDLDNLVFTFTSRQFWGESGQGVWTLKVVDGFAGETGTLRNWTLTLHGEAPRSDDLYVFTDEYAAFLAREPSRGTLRDGDGGVDTLNAAAVSSSMVIDLVPGGTSTIAGAPLVIAADTLIENAVGGDGNDWIRGNHANNWLRGGRGDDTLIGVAGSNRLEGGAGNDTLIGGSGADTAVFRWDVSAYRFLRDGEWAVVSYLGPAAGGLHDGTDRLLGIEWLEFNGRAFAFDALFGLIA